MMIDSPPFTMKIYTSEGQLCFESDSTYTQKLKLITEGVERYVNVTKPAAFPPINCVACFDPATDPVTLCPKTHIQCRKCAEAWIETCKTGQSALVCPICRKPATDQPYKDETIRSFETTLESIPWVCPAGCKQLIDHKAIYQHVQNCKPYECSSCNEVKVASSELLVRHKAICHEQETVCMMCNEKMKRKALQAHKDRSCPEAEITVEPAILNLTASAGKNVTLKRKYTDELQKITPNLFSALTELLVKTGISTQQPQYSLASNTPLQTNQQNPRVLAELEFTKYNVTQHVTYDSPQILFKTPTTPPLFVYMSSSVCYHFLCTLGPINNEQIYRRQIREIAAKPNSLPAALTHNRDVGYRTANEDDRKYFTFTLYGYYEGGWKVLETIKQTPATIFTMNYNTSLLRENFHKLELPLKSFYFFFSRGYGGEKYTKIPNFKFKLTASS